MTTIPQVAKAMQTVLTDNADIARRTGFVQRQSKLSGPIFAQSTVFGWLNDPRATLEALTQTAAALGVDVTPQGLDQRFTREAADFLEEVLSTAVTQVVAANPVAIPLLQRFTSVSIQDSSTVTLPTELAGVWTGCGGSTEQGSAAVKIQVRLDLLTGSLLGPLLENGRSQDKSAPTQTAPLPLGSLRLADLGYFSLAVFRDLAAQGIFYLSRLQVQTTVYDGDGNRLDLLRFLREQGPREIDIPVQIGAKHRLQTRLLAVRVPEEVANRRRQRLKNAARRKGQSVSKNSLALADWTILITNAPEEMLSLKEALVLARVRWQIELLFKLWKQHGVIDEWRSGNPWRILCELYAKLIALVIQHWLFLVDFWCYPDRSLVKAAKTISTNAPLIVFAMAGLTDLSIVIAHIDRCLAKGCRINRRKTRPNAFQLLLDIPDAA
jgi:hypothetical protein